MNFNNRKFAILFPGQGCQYVGMCNTLIQNFPIAAAVFEEASDLLEFDLRSLVLTGNISQLTLSENAQPAVVAASYALFLVFKELVGVAPLYVAGHSLGEITALIAAGALNFSDGILYARKRGELMAKVVQEKIGGAGVVLDLKVDNLINIINIVAINDYIAISGYNSPRQCIVAGTDAALLSLENRVDEQGGTFIPFKMMPMKVNAPYHSKLMAHLNPHLAKILEKITFRDPSIKIGSTVTGDIISSGSFITKILYDQLTLPVQWHQILKKMSAVGIELLIDIGPQEIMRNLVSEDLSMPPCFSFDNQLDRKKIFGLLNTNCMSF